MDRVRSIQLIKEGSQNVVVGVKVVKGCGGFDVGWFEGVVPKPVCGGGDDNDDDYYCFVMCKANSLKTGFAAEAQE